LSVLEYRWDETRWVEVNVAGESGLCGWHTQSGIRDLSSVAWRGMD